MAVAQIPGFSEQHSPWFLYLSLEAEIGLHKTGDTKSFCWTFGDSFVCFYSLWTFQPLPIFLRSCSLLSSVFKGQEIFAHVSLDFFVLIKRVEYRNK